MTAALAAAAAGLPWLTAAMTGPGYLYEKNHRRPTLALYSSKVDSITLILNGIL